MEQLPFIDVHTQRFDAPPDEVWVALSELLRRQMGGSAAFARLLGCVPAEETPSFVGVPGEAVPGFRVVEAERGRLLSLRGRHRFSRYELTFVIEGNHLRAETRAVFPGILGRLYRAAVIGSGAHRIITKRMLRDVTRVRSLGVHPW